VQVAILWFTYTWLLYNHPCVYSSSTCAKLSCYIGVVSPDFTFIPISLS